jgi:hypothetical protein
MCALPDAANTKTVPDRLPLEEYEMPYHILRKHVHVFTAGRESLLTTRPCQIPLMPYPHTVKHVHIPTAGREISQNQPPLTGKQ